MCNRKCAMLHWEIPVELGMTRVLMSDSNALGEGREAHNSGRQTLGGSQIKDATSLHQRGQHSLPYALWNTKEPKHSNIHVKCSVKGPLHNKQTTHKHATHDCLWIKMVLFLPNHSNWPSTSGRCCATLIVTIVLRHLVLNRTTCPHSAHCARGTLRELCFYLQPQPHSCRSPCRRCPPWGKPTMQYVT